MKHITGMDENMGICSWFNVVQPKNKPIDCRKWIQEPSDDEKAMDLLSTVKIRIPID